MQPFEKILEYSKSVCDQIRWKKARSPISEEIENHLVDQRDAYIADGMDEVTATDNAIVQMGDPVIIGTQLDRIHRPKPQWSMILLAAALLFIGLFIRIFIINDGVRRSMPTQFISVAIGLGFMVMAYFSDFTLIGKYPKTIYFSIIALSIVALIASPVVNGRAYYAGFMPLLFPLGFAAIIYVMRNKGYLGIVLCGVFFLLPACIALLAPTVSGFLLFAVSGLIVLSIAIEKGWFAIKKLYGYLLVFIPTAVTLLLAAVSTGLYGGWERLRIAINPSLDPRGGGWVGTVTRALLGGSKLFGRGEMPAEYKLVPGFPLPEIDTGFLLTYLIYEVGWIAFIIIMGVLLFFITKGFLLCSKQKSGLGLFVSVSVMLTFTMQVLGYVIANLGFQLLTVISLPLVSYGNVAMIINLSLIGLMLSVFRTGDIVKDKRNGIIQKENLITWSDGKLIISFGKK